MMKFQVQTAAILSLLTIMTLCWENSAYKAPNIRVTRVFDEMIDAMLTDTPFLDTAAQLQRQFGLLYASNEFGELRPVFKFRYKGYDRASAPDPTIDFYRFLVPNKFSSNFYVTEPLQGSPDPEKPHSIEKLAFDQVLDWMDESQERIKEIFYYTFYMPCTDCVTTINQYMERLSLHTNKTNGPALHIAYSHLYGADSDGSAVVQRHEGQRKKTYDRMVDLQGRLHELHGSLIHITDPYSSKEATHESCKEVDWSESFQLGLELNFSSGEPMAWLSYPNILEPEKYYVKLFSREKRLKADGLMKERMEGFDIFRFRRTMLSEGDYVQLRIESRKDIIHSSSLASCPWDKCGFTWSKLNKLPPTYPEIDLRLEIVDGSPKVCLQFRSSQSDVDMTLVREDKVSLQSVSGYSSAAPSWMVSDFIPLYYNPQILCMKTRHRMNIDFADGFYAKYVYKSEGKYQEEGRHDNVSPSWTPNSCLQVVGSATQSQLVPTTRPPPLSSSPPNQVSLPYPTLLAIALGCLLF